MRIAICEDDPRDLEHLRTLLASYDVQRQGPTTEVTVFHSAAAILEMPETPYDCYLLDIVTEGPSGIELARTLRQRGDRAAIIFLTVRSDLALAAFSVRATNYLIKPVDETALFATLDEIADTLALRRRKGANTYTFRTPGGFRTVLVEDILFVEIVRHTPFYHLKDGVVRGSDLRVAFEKSMGPLMSLGDFLCPHRSFRVNISHITSVGSHSIRLDDGESLPVARTRAAEVKSRFLDHLEASSPHD